MQTSKTVALFLILSLLSYILYIFSDVIISDTHEFLFTYPKRHRGQCLDRLSSLTRGRWEMKPALTHSDMTQRLDLDMLLRTRKGWPQYLYHGDLRCGPHYPLPRPSRNKTYPYYYDIMSQCEINSSTPCCNNYIGWCGIGAEYCECPSCTDYRKYLPAELAMWRTSTGCALKEFSRDSACDLLNNAVTSLDFIGDSLVRHVFTAMLLILTGDYSYGGLKTDIKKERKELCKHESQFADSMCHAHMAMSHDDVRKHSDLCGGRAKFSLAFTEAFKVHHYPLANEVISRTTKKEGAYVFLGIGIHNNFNTNLILDNFLKPLLGNHSKISPERNWPRIVWSATHAAGPLKPIFYHKKQGNPIILNFNKQLKEFCQENGLSVFDTFEMTQGVQSYDGTHYGIAVNILKAQILLNFIEEQSAFWNKK